MKHIYTVILIAAFSFGPLVCKGDDTQDKGLLVLQKVVNQLPTFSKAEHLNLATKRFISATFKEAWRFKTRKQPEDSLALGEMLVRDSLSRNGRILKISFEGKPPGPGNSVILFLDSSDGSLLYTYRGK